MICDDDDDDDNDILTHAQCLGQQFALNEASFFLVLYLQRYTRIELATDVQYSNPDAIPPEEWKKKGSSSRLSKEKVWPGMSLTAFVKGGLWVRVWRDGEE